MATRNEAPAKMEAPVTKELNLDEKVTVKNIAGWNVGFARIADGGVGDVNIAKGGAARLSRNEIIAQVQNGNKLFAGVDGKGSHATLIIEDMPTRVYLDFETEDGSTKQAVFSSALVEKLFKIGNQSNFETELKKAIATRAEKYALMEAIKVLRLNDFSKIRFCENYTGYKIQ